MCLVCVFLMIKKADNVLNNNFLIPSLSLLFRLYPFLFSLPSEQRTKKPNPCSPHLHRRQRRSTTGLYVRRSSSPQSALQDPASNRAFITTESSSHILSPSSCCSKSLTQISQFFGFSFFFSCIPQPIGWRDMIFVAV